MNNELEHHGIKGMRWGVRRYQNKDGSLTPQGKKRYDRDIRDNLAKKKETQIVNEYRKKHPKSNLSNTEILNNYYDY